MANNHEQFIAFEKIITINDSKRDILEKNREALRKRIRNYFLNNHPDETIPKFHQQGSFAMKTILEPIKSEKELGVFDLDDGVYFIENNVNDIKTINLYHNRIKEAVSEHTSKSPVDKDTCIRVEYADGHHIDLPIYFILDKKNSIPRLAHKKKGWIDSDPREFYKWFNTKADSQPQLRRIVKYLKAWCDYKEDCNSGVNMPSGCILTILATKYFVAIDKRDDEALKDVLVKMYNSLSAWNSFICERPTTPKGEDLFLQYSDSRKADFLNRLKLFKEDAEKAIGSKNPHDACEKWQKHFGNRFSCSTAKDEDEDARQNQNPGTLKNNSRFA